MCKALATRKIKSHKKEGGLEKMAEDNRLVEYYAAITFLLAIGYLLIITNPPPNLPQEGIVSISDIQANGPTVVIFLVFFCLLSFFIGLLLSSVYDQPKHKAGHFIPAIFVIVMLSSILYPYYGWLLAVELIPVGIFGFYLGMFYSPTFRKEIESSKIIVWFSVFEMLIFALIFIGFLFKWFNPLSFLITQIIVVIISAFTIVTIYDVLILAKMMKRFKKKTHSTLQLCSCKSG